MTPTRVYDIEGFVGLVGNTGYSSGPHAHIQYDAKGGKWPGVGYLTFEVMDKYLRIGRDKNDWEGRKPSELKPPSARNGTGRPDFFRSSPTPHYHAGWDISNQSGKGGSILGAPIRVINGATLIASSAKRGQYNGLSGAGYNITIALPNCTRIKIMHLKEKSTARIGKDPCNNPLPPSDRTTDTFNGDERLTPSKPKKSVDTSIKKDYDESPRVEDQIKDDSIIPLQPGTIDEYDRESESSIFEDSSEPPQQRSSSANIGSENTDKFESPTIGNKRSLSILETNETQFLGQDPKEKTSASSESSEKVEDDSLIKEEEKLVNTKKEPLNINGQSLVLFGSWVYDRRNRTNSGGIEFRGNISYHYIIDDGKLVYG